MNSKNIRMKLKKKSIIYVAFIILLPSIQYLNIDFTQADDIEPFTLMWSYYDDWEYAQIPRGIAPLAWDINGDGSMELFVQRDGGVASEDKIICINGTTGEEIWSINPPNSFVPHNPMELYDLNNDGDYELVMNSPNALMVFHAETGALWWRNMSIKGSEAHQLVLDTDGTGYPYIYTTNASNNGDNLAKIRKVNASTGEAIISVSHHYSCHGGITAGDVNNNGSYLLFISDRNYGGGKGLRCYDADTLELIWNRADIMCSSHLPVLADITGDGILNVIISYQRDTSDSGIYVLDALTGENIPGKCQNVVPGIRIHEQLSVCDINGDGKYILGTALYSDAKIFNLDTWQTEATLANAGRPPYFANVMGDEKFEVILSTEVQDKTIKIYNNNYDLIYTFPTEDNRYTSSLVQDIDGDGYNELIAVLWNGSIIAYKTLVQSPNPLPRTHTNHYSERNTNSAEYFLLPSGSTGDVICDNRDNKWPATGQGLISAFEAIDSEGVEIWIPEGNYYVDMNLTITYNSTKIHGAGNGTCIIFENYACIRSGANSKSTIDSVRRLEGLNNIQFDNFKFTGNGQLEFVLGNNTNVFDIIAENITLERPGAFRFIIPDNSQRVYNLTVTNCHTYKTFWHGFVINTVGYDGEIEDVIFNRCSARYAGWPHDGSKIDNDGNWSVGFDFAEDYASSGHDSMKVINLKAINCIAEYNWESGFHFESNPLKTNVVLENCESNFNGQKWYYDSTNTPNFKAGFLVSKDVTLINCSANYNNNYGFRTTFYNDYPLPMLINCTGLCNLNGLFRGECVWNGGNGTENSPYVLKTHSELDSIRNVYNAHWKLNNDIDLSQYCSLGGAGWNNGAGWIPIGAEFTGSFDGDGHVISNLFINRPSTDRVGLFATIAENSKVFNLGIVNVDVTGNNSVGGLVGYNYRGYIDNSYSTGAVTGLGERVGGLVGVQSAGAVNNSFSKCSVSGDTRIGGFIGQNYQGHIENCYSVGIISGDTCTGGFVGYISTGGNYANINNFWDTQTSGQTSSAMGTGKTSAQMRNVATFTDISTIGLTTPWDFIGNPNNDVGFNDYWDIDTAVNGGYPFLTGRSIPPSQDMISPEISEISISTSNPVDTQPSFGWENITTIVIDDTAVQSVQVQIIDSNNLVTNYSMIRIVGTNFYYYNITLLNHGNYSYLIRATDNNNNICNSLSYGYSKPPNWDIDNDGRCNILDQVFVSERYGETGRPGWVSEDLDNNGVIDLLDLVVCSNHFGEFWWS